MFGTQSDISADRGGIAAGRDIVGIPPEHLPAIIAAATASHERLNAELQASVAELERQLGASQEQVLGFFRIIGEAGIAVEAIPARLLEVAKRHKALLTPAEAESGGDAETARLNAELRAALESTDLERADALLAEVLAAQDHERARQVRELTQRDLEAATTCATRGEVAMTRLRYREAATHFGAAAARVPAAHETERINYLDRKAWVLLLHGDQFGDNEALRKAINIWHSLIPFCACEPLAWAAIGNNLGAALSTLGERSDSEALFWAVKFYEGALLEGMREREPLKWAGIQYNLGIALIRLGERGDDDALHRAVEAFDAALLERTPEHAPLDWARTQCSLGIALAILGERGDDDALRRAIVAYKAALLKFTRKHAPFEWATTQHNLGSALGMLGERGDQDALRRAVVCFEAALPESARERVPLGWAKTQSSLGKALILLGERGDRDALRRAVECFEAALEELSRRDAPRNVVARANWNLARARALLRER